MVICKNNNNANCNFFLAFQRILLRQMAELKTMIADLSKKLEVIGPAVSKDFNLPQPFNEIEKLAEFDKTLGDKKVFKGFVSFS